MQAYKSHAVLLFLFSHHILNIRWRAYILQPVLLACCIDQSSTATKHCIGTHTYWLDWNQFLKKKVGERRTTGELGGGGGPGIGGRRPVFVTFQIRRCDWLLHLPPSLRCRAAAFCIATWQRLLICACSVSMGLDDGLKVRGESAQKMCCKREGI